jgi:Uncharacterized protein conserved in bacteria (DUF2188)
MNKNIRVVPQSGQWAVKRDGAERAGSVHSTQQAAIQTATSSAKRIGGEVQIHGRNGQIRERNSYGNDSFPPRG